MGTRRGWPVLADPGPADHHPLPAAGQPAAGPRLFMCLSLAQGLTRPITPMGLAGFRCSWPRPPRRSSASRWPTRWPGRHGLRRGGTAPVRRPHGRAAEPRGGTPGLMPRVLDFMEARSAVVLATPHRRSAPCRSGNWSWAVVRAAESLRIAVRFRIPVTALARPGPAGAGLPRLRPADRGSISRSAWPRPRARPPPSGSAGSSRSSSASASRGWSADHAGDRAPAWQCSGRVADKLLGDDARKPATCRRCCARCRRTSRPRWTSPSGI